MVTLEQKEKGMKTVRMGAVLIGILFAFNAPSVTYAQEQNEAAKKVPKAAIQEQTRRGEAEPKVTIERAIQSAVADVRGRVHEVDMVRKKGKLVWEVEVITSEGRHFLVDVDGITGAVTHTEERSLEKLAGDPTKVKVIFEKHCVSCHGLDGKGTEAMGPLLIPPTTDYTSESSRQKSDCRTASHYQGTSARNRDAEL